MNLSSCGIDCGACEFGTKQNCPGCGAHRGKPFWGVCGLFACAAGKALPHCGKCGAFPCQKLIDAHKNENPDGNGIEIDNLRALEERTHMNEEIIAQAAEIVSKRCDFAGYCTLAQIDTDGYPTAATISPSKGEGIQWVTFCTGLGSNWAKRIEKCNRASVCFNAPEYNITLVGTIGVLTDLAIKKEMWQEGMGYYFSGPEDPGFCVLRFKARRYSLMLNEENGTVRGTL